MRIQQARGPPEHEARECALDSSRKRTDIGHDRYMPNSSVHLPPMDQTERRLRSQSAVVKIPTAYLINTSEQSPF